MSGFGERFRKAGYSVPKPLIEVDGRPIIEYVVNMFPGETHFSFICNRDHLNNDKYRMKEILSEVCPSGRIIGIKPHKLGPVHAVMQIDSYIDNNEPVIVNYCDFSCYWKYKDFKEFVLDENLDGAIPSYRGFHPHTIWSNYYAYLKTKNNLLIDIQEKKPFTKDPKKEFASSGTYYFKNGKILKDYFTKCIDLELKVNEEYYVSMVYKEMINDGLAIKPFELEHFMQWGTPRDLKDYLYWSDIFRKYTNQKNPIDGTLIMPMAGRGSRFDHEDYELPKPLIPINKVPMAVKAYKDLPISKRNLSILRKDLPSLDLLKKELKTSFENLDFYELEELTNGQAISCYEAIKNTKDIDLPLTISACDNGVIYDYKEFMSLVENSSIDIIVWVAKGYPGASRNPEMYGWADVDSDGIVSGVSVKKPLLNPEKDSVIIGTFTYKHSDSFLRAVEALVKRNGTVNSEFYIDSSLQDSIDQGKRVAAFEVDKYLCWGTPNDLKTYEYWQSCFNKWDEHPYKIINKP
tara:strand:+ start:9387 stop:10943 length:1557 start_codon:yes stop_codon:yes gene_type:complete